MSNMALLIANDVAGPAGVDFDTDIGYAPEDILADGPMAVPVYWLALFSKSDLVTVEVAGDEGTVAIPSLVTERGDALRRLAGRREALSEKFPEFRPTWDRFVGVVEGLTSRYLKVNLQELYDLEGEDFTTQLEAALRWFETGSEEDFAELLEMASISEYDEEERTFPPEAGVPRAFHLRGYANSGAWDGVVARMALATE